MNQNLFNERQLVEFAETWERGISRNMRKVWNAPILNINCCLLSISNISGPFQYARIIFSKSMFINGGKVTIFSITPDIPSDRNPGERAFHISEVLHAMFGIQKGIRLIASDQRLGVAQPHLITHQQATELEVHIPTIAVIKVNTARSPKTLEKPRIERTIKKPKKIYPCCKKKGGTLFQMCDGYKCRTPWWHKKCIKLKGIPGDLWLCENCRVYMNKS